MVQGEGGPARHPAECKASDYASERLAGNNERLADVHKHTWCRYRALQRRLLLFLSLVILCPDSTVSEACRQTNMHSPC